MAWGECSGLVGGGECSEADGGEGEAGGSCCRFVREGAGAKGRHLCYASLLTQVWDSQKAGGATKRRQGGETG